VQKKIAEDIEIQARRRFFAAAPAAFGCALIDLPDTPATLLSVTAMPSPIMNRVVGLPAEQALPDAAMVAIKAVFRARGIPRFWLHDWLQPGVSALADSLTMHRCQPQGAWTMFQHDLAGIGQPAPSPGLRLRVAKDHEYALAGQILAASFGMPLMVDWMAGLAGDAHWQVFFACDENDVPLATGTLLIDGSRAWLGMGATLPEARRRGAQLALLNARLSAASAAGCVTASIETAASAPGEVLPALNNIRRAGFRELGTRINYLCDV
jgi:GNAT superfamily N-acetyltransferase